MDQLSIEVRWIYSLFLIFALIGHLTFLSISVFRVGAGYDQIVRHYRGGENGEMSFSKEPIELLEVTHFHAYIEGIVLLVLAHLFVAVPIGKIFKRSVIGLAFGSTLLDLVSPWLIRFVAPGFAYTQMLAWIVMGISYLPLTFAPAYYIWRDRVSSKEQR